MCRFLIAAVSAVVLLAAARSTMAIAEDRYDYPWCLQGKDWGYPGLCHFSSYEHCLTSASGTFSYCGINPRFTFARQTRGYWRH